MINLPYLGIDENDLLDQIIQSKQSPNRVILENIRSAIYEDYDNYSNNERNFEPFKVLQRGQHGTRFLAYTEYSGKVPLSK